METCTVPWPSEFSELKKLDSILRCPICYELMTTSMITSCSHSYCSLCIRKFMQYKTECPLCHEETHEINLRKNRPLDDIINIYSQVKDKLLFTLRQFYATRKINTENSTKESDDCSASSSKTSSVLPDKNKNEGRSPDSKKVIDTVKPKKNISQSPKKPADKAKKPVVQKLFPEEPQPNCSKSYGISSKVEKITVNGVTIPPIFSPKSPKKNVSKKTENTALCPVCNVDIPVKNMNLHLDSCLARDSGSDIKPSVNVKKRKPLPKRVYDIMKEKDLKKFLKDYGLNTNGDRKTMTKRLQRYTVLYNAECDSENPRPIPELLSQIDREEREEKKAPIFNAFSSQRVTVDRNADQKVIEKANKDYLHFNKESFNKLIEAMRERDCKYIKPLKPLNRIESDEEEDVKPSLTIVDPVQPSTSNSGHLNEVDTVSVYSQDTIAGGEESDEDIFKKTPVKVEATVHTIDWVKTQVRNKDESGDEEEETDHQRTSQRTDAHTSPTTPHRPDVGAYPSPTTPARNNCSNLSFNGFDSDDDGMYESVFNTSSRTPKRLSKKTKGTQTPETSPVKLEHRFEQIFEETDVPELDIKSEADESRLEIDLSANKNDSSVEEVSSSRPEDESPPSPIIATFSPIKTRSKRKNISSEHQMQISSCEETRKRQKRIKPSVSPEI